MSFPRPFSQSRPHPWHGIPTGRDVPRLVHAYIEITPFDLVKYEVHKETGYLYVDRPQRTSSLPPTLYGFIPRTYCDARVAAVAGTAIADGDPLDICVLSERPIARAEVLLSARVLGGLQVLDGGEADDKIVAVLDADPYYRGANDLTDLPELVVDRLTHYFRTYKQTPDSPPDAVRIVKQYGREDAYRVVEAAVADYEEAASRP